MRTEGLGHKQKSNQKINQISQAKKD